MQTVAVRASTPYNVVIGPGLLREVGERLHVAVKPCAVALVTDSTVDGLYGDIAAASLSATGYRVLRFAFPAGEGSKNMSVLASLLEFLAENRLTRTDCVAALGGGVTGDLAGFAAAVYLRGVRYIQLPTTLLAAVDSSVGGKTAVDLAAGKNLAGAFHQPSLVLCDTGTFRTLPRETYLDGVAESVKHGVLADPELFERFQTLPDPDADLSDIVARNVAIKARYVEEDEFDTGARRILNLGHTAGHAVEKLSAFAVSHGKAVSIGMAIAARAAAKRGLCTPDCTQSIVETLSVCGLPTDSPYSAGRLAEAALSDKKRRGGTIAVIVPYEIGRCGVLELPVEELEPFFQDGMEEAT